MSDENVKDGNMTRDEFEQMEEEKKVIDDLTERNQKLSKENKELKAKVKKLEAKESKFEGKEQMEAEIFRLQNRLKRAKSRGVPSGMTR